MQETMTDNRLNETMQRNSSVPLYIQVKNVLRSNINKMSGPENMLPTESEICKKFKISRITTRQAMAELVREGLLVRIPGKGTFVNEHHLGEKNKERESLTKTHLIKLFVPPVFSFSTKDYFFGCIIRGIRDTIDKLGYRLVFSGEDDHEGNGIFGSKGTWTKQVQGIIFLDPQINDPYIRLAIREKVPFVVVGKYVDDGEVYSVDVDNVRSTFLATSHLIESGHRRIGLINGPLVLTVSLDLLEGFQKSLSEHGIVFFPELVVHGNFSVESGFKAMQKLIELPEPPTAVVAGDDLMAAGALKAVRKVGLRIPEDVSICGHNDTPLAGHTFPPLTTIGASIYDLAVAAANTLIKLIRKERVEEKRQLFSTTLIVRESTGPCKVMEPV